MSDGMDWDTINEYFMGRLSRSDQTAHHWPMKVIVSHTRDQTQIGGPPVGTRQIHLVCWRAVSDAEHCGQTVYVLARGHNSYMHSAEDILNGLRAHLEQCHSEDLHG